MGPNLAFFMKKVIITLILEGFDYKNPFFKGVVLVQVKKFGTGTWSVLKFYNCLAKGLKLKVIKFGEPILTLV